MRVREKRRKFQWIRCWFVRWRRWSISTSSLDKLALFTSGGRIFQVGLTVASLTACNNFIMEPGGWLEITALLCLLPDQPKPTGKKIRVSLAPAGWDWYQLGGDITLRKTGWQLWGRGHCLYYPAEWCLYTSLYTNYYTPVESNSNLSSVRNG